MDSDSDEEVFFGPVTAREEKISVKLKNRRTENFAAAVPLFRRRSTRPSLASLEEEDKVHDHDSTISLVVHKDSTCNDQSLCTGSQPSLCERSTDDISSQSSGLSEYTDESSVSAPDSHKSDAKPLFVYVSHSSEQVTNKKCDTEVEITQYNTESHSNLPQEISSFSGVEASCESSGDSALHSSSYQNSEDESFTRNTEGLETTEEGIPEADGIGCDKDTQVEASVKEKNDSVSDDVLKKFEIKKEGCLDETETERDDSISVDQITTEDQTSAASDESSCIVDNELITGDHTGKSITHEENESHQNHNDCHLVSASQEENDEVIEDDESHENSNSQEKVCHAESSQSSEQMAVKPSQSFETETVEQGDNVVKGTTLNEECEEDEVNDFDFQDQPRSLSDQSVKDFSFKVPQIPRLIKPRESYYSSLEVINVNEPLIYSGFVTEDSMDSTAELEQVIHSMDKMISQQGGEQQTIAVDRKYSSLCESLSEGSDSVFGSVAHNVDSVSDNCMHSDPEQRKISDFNDASHRISEGDDAVFNDVDDSAHKPKADKIDDSLDKDDLISPVTPPPKGPMKTSSDFNQVFTVTPPPSSIPTLRKVLPSHEIQSSPATVSYLSSSSQNLGDSCADSYGSVNKAMILSQSEDHEPVTAALQPGACQSPADSPGDFQYYSTHSDTDVQTYQSPKSQCRSGWTTYHTAKEGLDSPYDDSSDDESPQNKFNDTIEEMEMMLKYGLNYGEKAACANKVEGKEDACEKGNMNNTGGVGDDYGELESIISPRKSSVASTVSNFQPNLDSTHSSSLREDLLKCKGPVPCTDILEGSEVYSPATPNKKQKEAPPKPPRNLHNHNPLHSQVVGQSKLQNNKSPVPKLATTIRHKHSPLSTTPKVTKASTPRSGAMKQTVSRIRNEAPLVRSSSLTNISRTPKAGQSPANTPLRSTTGFRSQPSTPVTRTVAPVKKVSPRIINARSGLPPRAPVGRTSQRQNAPSLCTVPNIVSTPKGQNIRPKMQVSSASKILSPSVRAASNLKFQPGLSIVSPVAKYLKENPPPPLVVNVKPRHKISPVKIQAETKASQRSPLPGSNSEATQREAALSRIQGDLDKLASKMKSAQIAPNQPSEPVLSKGRVLPRAVYTSAPVVMDSAEDKENERIRKRREIPTDKHPVLVMKHRGRVKVPKVTFKEGLIESSPKGYKSPSCQSPLVSSLKNRDSLRNSLMEVSIYESHETQYTSTLQK